MPSFFFHIGIDLAEPPQPPLRWELPTLSRPDHERSSNDLTSPSLRSQHSSIHPAESPQKLSDGKPSERPPRTTRSQAPSGVDDWRLGKITVESIAMPNVHSTPRNAAKDALSNGLGTSSPNGLATKGRYDPVSSTEDELGWGVVRLYRDSDETPGLYDDPPPTKASKHGRSAAAKAAAPRSPSGIRGGDNHSDDGPAFHDEDCTTLCILAVPSYMTPSDFLGFVGEKTRDEVSHFRMIRTERSNRYMVLMKFRNGRRAREWRKEWNGKVFNDMEVRSRTEALRQELHRC